MQNPVSTDTNTVVNTATTLTLGFGPSQTPPPQMLVQNLSAGGTVTLPPINSVVPSPPSTTNTQPGVGDGYVIYIKSIANQNTTIAAASGETTDVALQTHSGDVTILQSDAQNSKWRSIFNGSASSGGNVITTVGAATTLAVTTRYLIVTAAATITLPTATAPVGQAYAIINESNGSLTITPASGTVNTTASFTLTTLKSAQFISDATNWHLLSN